MTGAYAPGETEADEPTGSSAYRSYEVYQRERVGQTTNLVNPRDLISDTYLTDPFTVPGVLRENYPCFRDWIGNRFWLSRYDDVTSVFVDDANFESRPIRSAYGPGLDGQDLGGHPELHRGWVDRHDSLLEQAITSVLDGLQATPDLAVDVADMLLVKLLEVALGTGSATSLLLQLVNRVKAGTGWDERLRLDGLQAHGELRALLEDQLAAGDGRSADDVLAISAGLGADADDVACTLVEMDLATLPASLANLWCLLLTHPEQFAAVRSEPRLMKFAYLEALRVAPPIATADRFARHEVERFGRLLPEGALVHLSAAAANRDPRQFDTPDRFDVTRNDLCRREPRGQYRADGLPAAITFGHGKPSGRPAVPRDEPRSRYALTRDIAVAVSLSLLERFPDIKLASGPGPMSLDRLGGTYRCRSLPVML